MKIRRILLAACLLATPAAAQVYVQPGNVVAVPAPCVPVVGTLANVGDSVTISCPNIAAFRAIMVPNQTTPFVGTLQATDPVSGVTRAIFKNVTGELDTSSVVFANGITSTSELAFVAFDGIKLTVTAAASGSAVVTLNGTTATRGTFQNNVVHNSAEGALRNGKAFTATTGPQTVAAGNNLSLLFSIPTTANYRAIIYDRVLDCTAATTGAGISNPTTLVTGGGATPATITGGTAATITNRRTGGAASNASVTYLMGAAHPDTNPATTNPPGCLIKANAGPCTLSENYSRTVEPGSYFVQYLGGAGLLAASTCYITYLWYEETLN